MKVLTATQILRLLLLTTASVASGCAAFRPIDGVPARYLAPELRAQTRSNGSTIDLSLLAQKPPHQHIVDGQDVLGIYIEGVLGGIGEAPPINAPVASEIAPSIGYPMSVRNDGSLSLPMIGAVNVRGMTIRQVEEHLRRIYTTERKILKEGADTIIVSLQRPRQVRVLVLRQETGGTGGAQFAQGLAVNLGQTKRGNGQVVNLPIYNNDVLHALAQTGGLPGLDAENTIYIIRRQHTGPTGMAPDHPHYPNSPTPALPQHRPTQQHPVMENHVSSNNSMANSNIQLVGYHPQANYGSSVEQVAAYNTSARQPVSIPTMENRNQFQNPVYQNRETPNIQDNGSVNQFTIEPAVASNFGNPDPLAELRVGMTPVNQENFSEQVVLQREVTIEQTAATQFNQPGYPQPSLQQLPSQYPLNEPSLNGQPPFPVENAPINNFVAPPQLSAELNPELGYDQSASHDQFWSQVDLGMNNSNGDPTMNNQKVIKIPIRLKPGEQPHVRPEDIILQDGDIVFIESRDTEIFYTGGLLGGGQYTLPRDYDLDVLDAISLAQGASQQQSTGNQIGGTSALNGDVTISASSVVIIRRMPNGAQVPIKVDLYRALTDPSERILIQPGDMVMLRYKMHEAVGAFIERNILSSALLGLAFTQFGGNGGN